MAIEKLITCFSFPTFLIVVSVIGSVISMILNFSDYCFKISFSILFQKLFSKEKRKKRKQELSGPLEDAECYKSLWAAAGQAVMRMQHTGDTILAALLVRFE